jgi:hypothetical protein
MATTMGFGQNYTSHFGQLLRKKKQLGDQVSLPKGLDRLSANAFILWRWAISFGS